MEILQVQISPNGPDNEHNFFRSDSDRAAIGASHLMASSRSQKTPNKPTAGKAVMGRTTSTIFFTLYSQNSPYKPTASIAVIINNLTSMPRPL